MIIYVHDNIRQTQTENLVYIRLKQSVWYIYFNQRNK